jgi:hypothetical protein
MIKKVTPSEKKKLKERLRKLDKKLYRFYWFTRSDLRITNRQIFPGMYIELKKLDDKRKEIRNKLK